MQLSLNPLNMLEKEMRWVRFYFSLVGLGDYRAGVESTGAFQKQIS